jgi:hypothetical protein
MVSIYPNKPWLSLGFGCSKAAYAMNGAGNVSPIAQEAAEG